MKYSTILAKAKVEKKDERTRWEKIIAHQRGVQAKKEAKAKA